MAGEDGARGGEGGGQHMVIAEMNLLPYIHILSCGTQGKGYLLA